MTSSQIIHLTLFAIPLLILSQRLPRFALHRPITLSMIFLAILLFGVAALIQLPVELMPNVSYGNVTIFVDVRGGMPPPEIEELVTKPIEGAMSTVSKLRNLVSSSKKDRAIVTLEFDSGTNMDLALLEVREKFLRVKHKLPSEIERPIIARYEESDSPIFIVALTSEKHSPEEIRRFVDCDIKEKLMRIDGVANVEISGGQERKIVVEIDRNRLAAFGLPIKKVVSILEQNNLNLAIGEVKGAKNINFGVKTVGAFRTIKDIESITLAVLDNGGRIRLSQIAEIKDSYLEKESVSRLNAKAAITLYIQKETTANTVKIAEMIEKEFENFSHRLPFGIELVSISNHKKMILSAIDSVKMTLLYGVVLVVLVLPIFLAKTHLTRWVSIGLLSLLMTNLLLFYWLRWPLNATIWPVLIILLGMTLLTFYRTDLRTAFVVALAIPASVLMTLAFMFFEGISINIISLSGLIIGIGLLVDNAAVVAENYDRILSENPAISPSEAMLKSANEMVPSIIGGTLTTVVVFLPFSLLQKQTQLLFAGISFAVTASLFSSLFIELTLIPVLVCKIDLRKISQEKWEDSLLKLLSAPNTKFVYGLLRRFCAESKQNFSSILDLKYVRKILQRCRPKAPGKPCTNLVFDALREFMSWSSRYQDFLSSLANRSFSLFPRGNFSPFLLGLLGFISIVLTISLHFILKTSWLETLFIFLVTALVLAGMGMILNYSSNLIWCLSHKKVVLGSVISLFVFAMTLFIFILPKDAMVSSEQNEFIVFVELDTGVRLDISNRIVEELEKSMRDYPPTQSAIRAISSRVEGWSSKIYVTLKDLSERKISTQEVIDTLRPEVERVVNQYAQDYKAFSYFSEPRAGKEIFLEVFGHEYEQMAKIAMELASRVGQLKTLSDVKIRYRPNRPQISVVVDPYRSALFGLDTKEIADTLHAQMRGLRATTLMDQSSEIETVVRIQPQQRQTVEQLKNLILTTDTNEQIPLAHSAQIKGDFSPSEIWHRNKARMIQVSANLGNTPLETAAKASKDIFKKISFPQEYYADIGGQYEEMVQSNRDFWKALILTTFLVFMVMACQFQSYWKPLVIMGTIILSAIGIVAVLSIFRITVSLGVLVGFLMLGGIVVNNGIMLIDKMNNLKEHFPNKPLFDLITEAGRERIRPIFITTTTTVLGLMPMALDRSENAILWSPLAITVIGGLVTSTILTLFVVPCLLVSIVTVQEKLKDWTQYGISNHFTQKIG